MKSKLVLATLFLFAVTPVYAITPYEIRDMNGNPFINLRIFNVGDGLYADGLASTWNLHPWQIDQTTAATHYLGNILQTVPGRNPAIINVGTFDGPAAAASSWNATPQFGSPSTVQAALTNQPFDKLDYGAHGYILVGYFDWSTQPYIPSQLALNSATSLDTVLVHEVAHALGVLSNAYGINVGSSDQMAFFNDNLNAWSSHLRDDNGKRAAPGQYIFCAVCVDPNDDDDDDEADDDEYVDVFDVRRDQAYFEGENVTEVLNGAMKGLPMRVQTDYGPLDSPLFSHIELKNGLMSHQYYRNYTTLMEAELAALQDIGYTIDRRNFYGHSIYNDGLTYINDNPFFARNSAGTAYIPNTYNTATLGIGLHVYGSNNSVTQRADLLSAGTGGAGIRIDGQANDLTILPATKVHANGENGRAVMFAYGKGHTLTQRGDVEALGENGIAVSFDFGHNSRGDATGYRGSYIVENIPEDLLERQPDYREMIKTELGGPLVSRFDLTGRVAGQKAAIFMSENALVGDINILRGASITGDIISNYDEEDEDGNQRLTNITFGLQPDSIARATSLPDADFKISYLSNITGKNLALQFLGGTSTLMGNHNVYNVDIGAHAMLAGSGSFTINPDELFYNQGKIKASIPGQSITINGRYAQNAKGVMELSFNEYGAHSGLIINGETDLDGTIAFAPVRGYYQNGFEITSNEWLIVNQIAGGFNNVSTSLTSPTLSALAIDNGEGSYTVKVNRSPNGYASFADNSNARNVGDALDQLIDAPPSALKPLIAALDFSAADGSTIQSALPQLTGEAYASVNSELVHASGIIRSTINHRLVQAFEGVSANSVSVMNFAPDSSYSVSPSANAIKSIVNSDRLDDGPSSYAAWGYAFGSWASQSGDGNALGIKSTLGGFASGVDANVYDNWRLGLMAGYSRSTLKASNVRFSGDSDNYTIGAYAGTEWSLGQGELGFRSGVSNSWHNIDMTRAVSFNGYSDSLTASYNGTTFQAFGELGYKHKLSERTIFEPYANLAYVHVRSDGFTEQGSDGAALNINSESLNIGFSTLGMRASTSFDLGATLASVRVDLGWQHAFGNVIPTSTAHFSAGSEPFNAAGSPLGKDTALFEAGLDVVISRNTKLGISYAGQYGSQFVQNGFNADLAVKF